METPKRSIVIAEDDSIIKMVMEDLIESMGHNVVGLASNSDQVLQLIKDKAPDVVILDIGLEGDKDGIDVAQIINERFQIPFIFVTGNSDHVTVEKANKTNPIGYIIKPFDETTFKEKISNLLMDQ